MNSTHIDSMASTETGRSGSSQPTLGLGSGGSLNRDPLLLMAIALFGLMSLPYLIPVMNEDQMWSYGFFIDLPFVTLMIVAIRYHLPNITDPAERRFWRALSIAPTAWLGMGLINVFVTLPSWKGVDYVISDLTYIFFYATLAIALENPPHLPTVAKNRRLRALNRIGAFVFLFGALLYITVLPGLFNANVYWNSSLLLFVVLDAYIVVRLAGHLLSAKHSAWRATYSWMLLASSMWLASDICMALMWHKILPFVDFGTVWDLLWPLSIIVIVAAARTSVHQRGTGPSHIPEMERLGVGPLVFYAVAAPLLHLVVYRLGSADPELRPYREVLVVVFASALAGMALAYQALLRRENRRLTDEEARIRARLEHQAFHDELTELPNRSLFRDHLRLATARAKRFRTRCAVLYFDLDQFKVINDSLGHEAGDRILIAVAERLRSRVREVDTVARFGGDEFSVLVQDIREVFDAAMLAENLIASLGEPIFVDGREHVLAASVGVALYPDDGEDEATLLKHADIAMYQAKSKGRNSYRLFTPAMNGAAENRLAIEEGLRDALANDHLVVHYQPIIDLATRRPVGCEALLRWNHPEKGLIGPDSFIGVAEQTGLIVPAGEWVLEMACAWAQQLNSTQMEAPSIAVNLSARQLQDPRFAFKTMAILDRIGLDPSRLQLEVTESMTIETAATAEVLGSLREMGIRIAIDDLGTGFSGLRRLRDLPMDVIKIDRSFIRRIHDDPVGEAIVRGVVGIAKALDLYVVAEGVETEAELAVVERLKCHAAQGFLLHYPLPPEELAEFF